MRLCINMLIFTHNLGNWLIISDRCQKLAGTHQTDTTVPGDAVWRG